MGLQILRLGSEGEDVRAWQHFLLGQGLLTAGVDGVFGPHTETATRAFQKRAKTVTDGAVGPLTYAAALERGFDPGFTDPHGGTSGADWPPPPAFAPLVSNTERAAIFGRFDFERIAPGKDEIRILGGWADTNIVPISIPQLRGVKEAPATGRIRVHRMVKDQMAELFAAWDTAGLMPLVKTWAGSFNPRFVRGNAKTLSNHAWATGFDINAAWNARGTMPAVRGKVGSVRELVPIAHAHGFYWGGHFSRRDGMHFEVARVLG